MSVRLSREDSGIGKRGAAVSLNPGAYRRGRTNLRPLSLMGKERRAFRELPVTRFDESLSSACCRRSEVARARAPARATLPSDEKRVSLTFPYPGRSPQPLTGRAKTIPQDRNRVIKRPYIIHARRISRAGHRRVRDRHHRPRLVSLAADISSSPIGDERRDAAVGALISK